jgi:hypothetical protein
MSSILKRTFIKLKEINSVLKLIPILKNYFKIMAYLTQGDLQNYILQDIDASFSTWITSVIAQVEAYIDNYCGTDFANAAAGTRYFDGSGNDVLVVGDFSAITEVKILDTDGADMATLAKDTDYFEYPYNETIKNSLHIAIGGQYALWPDWQRAVKVTGVFGYVTIPDPVKLAAIQLAAKIINEGLRGGQVSGETLGSYRIDYRQTDEKIESLGIKEILNQYRAITL